MDGSRKRKEATKGFAASVNCSQNVWSSIILTIRSGSDFNSRHVRLYLYGWNSLLFCTGFKHPFLCMVGFEYS